MLSKDSGQIAAQIAVQNRAVKRRAQNAKCDMEIESTELAPCVELEMSRLCTSVCSDELHETGATGACLQA